MATVTGKRKRCFESDAERVHDRLMRLPSVRFTHLSFDETMSSKLLKRAALSRGIDTTAILERRELLNALQAHRAEHDTHETCPICLDTFSQGDLLRVMLCGHEYHHECLARAVQSELERTGEMPRCPCCRMSIKGDVA